MEKIGIEGAVLPVDDVFGGVVGDEFSGGGVEDESVGELAREASAEARARFDFFDVDGGAVACDGGDGLVGGDDDLGFVVGETAECAGDRGSFESSEPRLAVDAIEFGHARLWRDMARDGANQVVVEVDARGGCGGWEGKADRRLPSGIGGGRLVIEAHLHGRVVGQGEHALARTSEVFDVCNGE